MGANDMLSDLIYGVQVRAVELFRKYKKINLIGATAVENEETGELDITLPGGGGGGGGGSPGGLRSVASYDALEALTVAGATIVEGTSYIVQADPTRTWVWSNSGATFAGERRTLVQLTETGTGTNGRFFSRSGDGTMPTHASVRLATAGKHSVLSVQARTTARDGGGGTFDYDASDTTSADNGGTILVAGTRRYKRRYSGPLDVRWFGADATGVADSLAAFNLATIACAAGATIYVAPGVYKLSAEWVIGKSIEVCGEGASGCFYLAASVLVWPKATRGIVLNDQSSGASLRNLALSGCGFGPAGWGTIGWSRWLPTTAYSVGDIVVPEEWSYFGWTLRCTNAGTSGGTPPAEWHTWTDVNTVPVGTYTDGGVEWELLEDKVGVAVLTSLCTLDRVYTRAFSGNGFNNIANNPSSFGNATKWLNCFAHSNAGHGFMFAGEDANAGYVLACDAIANGGFACHDKSFLENAHLGWHCSENEGGASLCIHGTLTHAYVEGSQGSMFVDGTLIGPATDLQHYYRKTWSAAETVIAGEIRRPTTLNGWYYRCSVGGTTHSAEPAWSLARGFTVVEGGGSAVRWVRDGIYWNTPTGPTQVGAEATSNLTVRNRRNPDDARLFIGGPPSTTQNALLGWQAYNPQPPVGNGFGLDLWFLNYDAAAKSWRMMFNFVSLLWETFDRGNTRALDHRVQYYPYGIRIGRQLGDLTTGSGADDYGPQLSSGNVLPTTGLWHKGYVHLHADPIAGEPKFWTCVQAGGWSDTTRANTTAVALRALIEPTAGHVWECTTAGTTAGSPPTFTPGPGTVNDGTVVWTYRGTEPPLFESVLDGATGPEGPQGDPGADGDDGADGADGADATPTLLTATITATSTAGYGGSYDIDLVGPWNHLIANVTGGTSILNVKTANGAAHGNVFEISNVGSEDLAVNDDDGGPLEELFVVPPMANGVPGYCKIVFDTANWRLFVASLTGGAGPEGPEGPQGDPGADGDDGADGADAAPAMYIELPLAADKTFGYGGSPDVALTSMWTTIYTAADDGTGADLLTFLRTGATQGAMVDVVNTGDASTLTLADGNTGNICTIPAASADDDEHPGFIRIQYTTAFGWVQITPEPAAPVDTTILTQIITNPPIFNNDEWEFSTGNNSGLIQSLTNGGDKCAFVIDLPEGRTVTDLEVWIQPPGSHGALPSTMPQFVFTRVDRNTGVATTIDTQVDASGSVGAYEAYHSLQMGGLSEVVNTATRKYVINFTAETDTNALAGTTIGMLSRTIDT